MVVELPGHNGFAVFVMFSFDASHVVFDLGPNRQARKQLFGLAALSPTPIAEIQQFALILLITISTHWLQPVVVQLLEVVWQGPFGFEVTDPMEIHCALATLLNAITLTNSASVIVVQRASIFFIEMFNNCYEG